jgi:hypothetical protein
MKVTGEEYSARLRTYSDDTIRLIMSFKEREKHLRALEIVSETDTEEEVIEKLNKLKQE